MSDTERALWDRLRAHTRSRIGLGRAGDALDIAAVLDLSAAHAAARDAVHSAVDADALAASLSELGVGPVPVITSRAPDRSTYLRRPDLGRQPADLSALCRTEPDVAIVVCDGLSARAVTDHAVPMVRALVEALGGAAVSVVVATQARVALGDHVAAALGADAVVVLIGERPGLSVADSLGAYLSYRPRPGMADSERNCVSNIHSHGVAYPRAAAVVAALLAGAKQLGRSGVDLKDTSEDVLTEAQQAAALG
ncbi:ethanolamine ammonia-lyase subunit EutC [Mycolicibacterium tokaiense]|uniref:Ethanolamine ammonia-lyase small subunit n=1 Tax=Mycolicibacterium tokaiense TaxID=39695 RepID=A0A378TNN2_9MYCO|nr:ethanolamine ammonia-lyase subunit EutC [Mycolicibacterium tokaiense]BBY90209.1 ethanolamine ammonia-lyase light chain [Mycolicibacterium tokaiense]STZ61405.1 ethanolamine ammonia-lyase small subunit [Mycolicibacterium tokaiense]